MFYLHVLLCDHFGHFILKQGLYLGHMLNGQCIFYTLPQTIVPFRRRLYDLTELPDYLALADGSYNSAFIIQDSNAKLGLSQNLQPVFMQLLPLSPLDHNLPCLITYVDIHISAYIVLYEYKLS